MSYEYRVSARRTDTGEPVTVTIETHTEAGITYNEYWTGPASWWKRILRRVRGGDRG